MGKDVFPVVLPTHRGVRISKLSILTSPKRVVKQVAEEGTYAISFHSIDSGNIFFSALGVSEKAVHEDWLLHKQSKEHNCHKDIALACTCLALEELLALM